MTMCRNKPNNRPASHRRVSGFSLIELIAVLVIVAVVAGLVVWSVRSHLARARMTAACELLRACDGNVRHVARAHGTSLALQVRSATSSIHLPNGRVESLGRGITVDRLWTPRAAGNRGTLHVVMSPTGQSDTYAIRLKSGKKLTRWIVVLGASGQCIEMKRERQVRQLLAIR